MRTARSGCRLEPKEDYLVLDIVVDVRVLLVAVVYVTVQLKGYLF